MCVEIYTPDGREVGTREQLAELVGGPGNIVWQATDNGGDPVATIDGTCCCAVDVRATLTAAGFVFGWDDSGDFQIFTKGAPGAGAEYLIATPARWTAYDLLAACESLLARVRDLDDAGPPGETWQSDGLKAEIAAAGAAIRAARGEADGDD